MAVVACLALAGGATADVMVALDDYQYLSGPAVWEYTYAIDNQTGADYPRLPIPNGCRSFMG